MILFSIIIPTYNRATFISNTIHSVLNQDYSNFEIIIVDDGSTDNTEEVVKAINDNRIKYYKKTNGERGAARNHGIKHASGQYITFLDSDDLLYPNHFSAANKIIESQHPYAFALSHEIKNSKGLTIHKNILPPIVNNSLLRGNILSCIGVFIKKDIFKEYTFEEDRKFSGTEDWALWLRLAARYEILGSPEITSVMIDHDNRSVKNFKEESLIFRANYLNELLLHDTNFVNKYSTKTVGKIKAHMLSYTSLHLAMSKNIKLSYKWLFKACLLNVDEIFSRRFLAINKINFFNLINKS